MKETEDKELIARRTRTNKIVVGLFLFAGIGSFITLVVALYYLITPGDIVPLALTNKTDKEITVCLFDTIMQGQLYLPFRKYSAEYNDLSKEAIRELPWKFTLKPNEVCRLTARDRSIPEIALIRFSGSDETKVAIFNTKDGIEITRDDIYRASITSSTNLQKCPKWLLEAWDKGYASDASKRPK